MAYLPLSTANLPDPVIDPAQGASPADHFNTVLWTGDGTSGRSITTGHQPDFVWTKERNSAINHIAQNSISGTGLYLHPNTTAAEQSATTLITSFDSNGFTVGNSGSINGSSDTYVAWSWKANGSGVSNTDGDIPTTVSVNTTSGFSIVSYTCPATTTTGDTIGHGLGVAPEFAIFKNRDTTTNWGVYHKDIGNTGGVLLNDTGATITSVEWWNNTSPTSTEMSLGRFSYVQNNSQDYIAYCFHSVDGFSKFGTYEGTNNANGPYIYLGFKPKFFMLKNIDSALQWIIFDGERDPFNVVGKRLFPAVANGESAVPSNSAMDFTSNGVKIRIAGGYDVNDAGTYIYMAFAENPFKYSNAR